MSATDIGFNFRRTSGYVTDGADETYVLDSTSYPTTRAGWTFGWENLPVDDRNYDSAGDRRLAGINYCNNAADVFRVDLPSSGAYEIRAAFGMAVFGDMDINFDLVDDATVFRSISESAPGADNYYDATGVLRSGESDWINNNAAEPRTFGSTILRVACTSTNNTPVAHLRIVQAATTASPALALLGVGA